MELRAAIEDYHRILDSDHDLAAECQARLDDRLVRRNLLFGQRPLVSVLRPRFLAPEQYVLLRRRIRHLLGAFDTVYTRAVSDPEFCRLLRLEPWEEELIGDDPGYVEPTPVSRVDAFFTPDGGSFRVTEYNAETPAAAAYNDVLANLFLALPVMCDFLRDWELRGVPGRHQVLHALLDAYRQWSGRRDRPRIAILDWRDVPTYSEFLITADYLRLQGLECVIADPREVEYRNGRLVAEGMEIDLVYKRVLITELVERGGLDHPLIRAVRERAVCMVNPFRCKVLHKKAVLGVLSDEANTGMFSPEQQEAISAHVPWTRLVEEGRTRHEGQEVDLLPYVAERRERFVLKPNDDYGGKGIILGWTVEADEWRRALESALRTPYVLQERIELPVQPYPAMAEGGLAFGDRIEDTAPFAFHGQYVEGCLTRLSTDALVNVTAGGGSSAPTFIVARR